MPASGKAITFNEGQVEGIAKAVAWFRKTQDNAFYKRDKPVFFLTGYAGTGKTSVAKAIAEQCGRGYEVVFIAPTGKAASRLRQKGCDGAKTLHQFVYNFVGLDELDEPIFAAKGALKETPRLVVLDEGSMVDEYDMGRLLAHNIPVLGLGDLGQLPPVRGKQALRPEHVDHELIEIERNAGNIVRAATFVREGKRLPIREYDDVHVREADNVPTSELMSHIGEDDQILCSFNNSRLGMTSRIRAELGHKSREPQIGEKVMCWFNQHDHNFMNGEQGIVLRYEDIPSSKWSDDEPEEMQYMWLKSLTDGRERKVKYNPLSFSTDPDVQKEALRGVGGFQFGYVATIHKAQGSEWKRVLIKEEAFSDYSKLMYTGITRAIDELTFYRRRA